MSQRAVVVVVALVSSLASAQQDAGFEWVPGVYVGDAGLRLFQNTPPAFVDSQQRAAVLSSDRLTAQCVNAAYDVSGQTTAGPNETFQFFALDAALSEVWLVSIASTVTDWHLRLSRWSCDTGRTGPTFDLPWESVATVSDRGPNLGWVMAPGVVELAAPAGFFRVDTSVMTPALQQVTDNATVLVALAETPPTSTLLQKRGCVAGQLGERLCSVGTLFGQSVVSIDPTGLVVQRLAGPVTGTSSPMGLSLLSNASFEGLLVFPWQSPWSQWKRVTQRLGLLGGDRRFYSLRTSRETNTALGGGLNALIPGAGGTQFVGVFGTLPNGVGYVDVLPLSFDVAATDFDLDGLTRAEELAAGTRADSDDTDGDGVNDGVELHWFSTDALDAGSRPPRHPPAWAWGYNGMIALPRPAPPSRPVPACPTHDPGPCAPCREANGQVRAATGACQPTGGLAFTATTRDGTAEFIGVKDSASPQFTALQRLSSDPVLFPSSVPISSGDPVFAADANTVYQLGRLASGTRLVRFTPQGSEELSLQTGCPLARVAPGCVERLHLGTLTDVSLLESVGARSAVFAAVEGRFGAALVALDEQGYHQLADLTDVGLVSLVLGFDARASDFLFTGAGNLEPRHEETWRMGTDFSAVTLRRNELDTSYGPFRPLRFDEVADGGRGYPAQRQETWFVDPEPAGGTTGCVSVGGVTLCDFGAFPSTPVPVRYVSMPPEELRPTERHLRPGDVVVASPLGTWTTTDDWGLSKLDRFGTVNNWLSEADFIALIDDAAERDALVDSPLGKLISLAVAPDALSLCLVESTTHRLWLVQLDPATRAPTRVTRVLTSAFTGGCAFDATGHLVTATDDELRRDGVAFATALSGIDGFAWLDDRWVTWGLGRPTQCFDAAGQTDGGLGWSAVAVASFAGGVAWVDETGRAFVGTRDELCDRLQVPRERFVTDDRLTFSEVLSNDVYRPISRRRIEYRRALTDPTRTRASLVMRGDGLGLYGAWNRWVDGLGFDTPLKGPDALFFFEPALQPKDLAKRWPQFDPYRREAFTWTFLAPLASPMALVPGDAGADTGRYDTPKPWVPDGGWPDPVVQGGGGGATGGGSGGGGGGGTMNPPGCTCGSVDLGGLALAALLLLSRRRR